MFRKAISIIAILFLAVSSTFAITQRRAIVVNDSIVVKPNQRRWITFNVGRDGARLIGSFRAEGGSRNDIKVVVMTTEELENYNNGNEATVNYTSRTSKTVGRFNVYLPEGEYCILFDNPAIVSNKVVRIIAELQY